MDARPIDVAPMEGLTGWQFRLIHHALYPDATRYYTPFLSPIDPPGLTPKALAEVTPAHNGGIVLVPQLLTNRADHFCNAARTLAEMGYTEVDLNLGCPSGTVVSKGKASGMLCDPDAVDRLLDGIFRSCPLAVSVKTRIGRFSADELPPLMEVYNRYPITRLTVHPRIRTQMYRGKPDLAAFAYICSCARMPLCYNGDLFTPEDVEAFDRAFPARYSLMLGRGVIANPGLIGELRGRARTDGATLRRFHDELLAAAIRSLSGDRHVLHRMKELWFYLICLFEDADRIAKQLRKSERMADYLAAVDALFATCPISPRGGFRPPAEQSPTL